LTERERDGGWDIVVGLATTVWARRPGVRMPARVRDISLLQVVRNGYAAHPASV